MEEETEEEETEEEVTEEEVNQVNEVNGEWSTS
jgi:hypothetical protein